MSPDVKNSQKHNRTKLYLYTNGFPWGSGEKSFVIPEIEALRKDFDVTVVSLAADELVGKAELATSLSQDITVLHWSPDTRLRRLLWAMGMPFTHVGRREIADLLKDGMSFGRLRDSLALYSSAKSLQSFCRKSGVFDETQRAIYLCFWFSTQCLALTLEKEVEAAIVLVSRTHGYDLYNHRNSNGRQPWQRCMKSACNRVLFLSKPARDYFENAFGPEAFAGQYRINGLGVSDANSSPERPIGAMPRIVSCSNVIPIKRVDLIAEAVGLLPRGAVEWVHFGDGPEMEGLRKLADELGIDVRFKGHVDNSVVRRFYEENYVDAFVTTSASEGVPVSIEEALACGIPVIGTAVGGIPDQIDGNGILLSENPTPDEVASAITRICKVTPEERRAFRRRSRIIWAKRYDVKKNKRELLEILHELS